MHWKVEVIDNRRASTRNWPPLEEHTPFTYMEGCAMTTPEDTPLGRAMRAVANIGMEPHEVSAIENVTIGLEALADQPRGIPYRLLVQWQRNLTVLFEACPDSKEDLK